MYLPFFHIPSTVLNCTSYENTNCVKAGKVTRSRTNYAVHCGITSHSHTGTLKYEQMSKLLLTFVSKADRLKIVLVLELELSST